jgi:DNA-binding MarR family transcriptional regulator
MDAETSAGRLNRALTTFYEKFADWEDCVAEQVGLTPRQAHAVAELGESGPIRMKPLADRLGVTTGTLTILADRLENLGLIRRVPDPSDRRATTILLTDAGEGVFHRHRDHHQGLAREFLASLEAEEADTLVRLLAKVSAVL